MPQGSGKKPLDGVRVFLSREPDSHMARVLTLAGATVAAAPLCVYTPREHDALAAQMERLAAGEYAWMCLSSPRTLAMIDAAGFDTPAILASAVRNGTQIAVVGPTTAVSVFDRGQRADLTAGDPPSSAALVTSFSNFVMVEDRPILIPCASIARETLPIGLRALGWDVEVLHVYDTTTAGSLPEPMAEGLGGCLARDGMTNLFLVTSGSVARAASTLFGEVRPPAVALGEPSASMLRQLSWPTLAVCSSANMPDIIDALAAAANEIEAGRA